MLATIIECLDQAMIKVLDTMVVCMAGLLLVLLNYAVFMRFILNDSVSWGEELPAYLLAVLTFTGAAYLTRINEHIGFDGVLRLMPLKIQSIISGLNLFVMMVMGATFAWYGLMVVNSFGTRLIISLDIPMALFRSALPFGCALIAAICFVRLIALITGQITAADLMPESDE